MVDAYVMSNLQESLGLSDEQFAKAIPLVKKLQTERREYLLERTRTVREMRRLLREGGATEAQVLDLLQRLKALDADGPTQARKNLEALDAVLTPAPAGEVPGPRAGGRAAHARAREPRARPGGAGGGARRASSAASSRRILAAYGQHQEEAKAGKPSAPSAGTARARRPPRRGEKAGREAEGGRCERARRRRPRRRRPRPRRRRRRRSGRPGGGEEARAEGGRGRRGVVQGHAPLGCRASATRTRSERRSTCRASCRSGSSRRTASCSPRPTE